MSGNVNVAPLSDALLQRFGLHRQPFANDGFVFEHPDIEARLNLAVHLLQSTDKVIVVVGAPGVGRTTLLHHIAERASTVDCAAVVGNAHITLGRIARSLPGEAGEARTGRELVQSLAAAQTPIAILLDDAEAAPQHTLGELLMLRRAVYRAGGALPLLLSVEDAAESDILEALSAHKIGEDRLQLIRVAPLPAAHIKDYLHQRLAAAGYSQPTLPFSRSQLRRIVDRSGGRPRLIHLEAARMLGQEPESEPDDEASPAHKGSSRLYWVVGAAVSLLVVGLVTANYLAPGPLGGSGERPGATPESSPSQTNTAEPAQAETGSGQRQTPTANATGKVRRDSDKAASHTAEWLSVRNPKHYTLQLLGAYERDKVESFVADSAIADRSHIVAMTRQGRRWYVVVTGDYPSSQAARSAMRRLPRELRDSEPWPRRFSSLQ